MHDIRILECMVTALCTYSHTFDRGSNQYIYIYIYGISRYISYSVVTLLTLKTTKNGSILDGTIYIYNTQELIYYTGVYYLFACVDHSSCTFRHEHALVYHML